MNNLTENLGTDRLKGTCQVSCICQVSFVVIGRAYLFFAISIAGQFQFAGQFPDGFFPV